VQQQVREESSPAAAGAAAAVSVATPTTMRASCGCHLRRGSCAGCRPWSSSGEQTMMENGEWNGQEQRKRKIDLGEDKEGDKSRMV